MFDPNSCIKWTRLLFASPLGEPHSQWDSKEQQSLNTVGIIIRKPASFPGNENHCSDLSAFTQPEMRNSTLFCGYALAKVTTHSLRSSSSVTLQSITLPASGSDYRLPTHHFSLSVSCNASSDCGAVTRLDLLSAGRPNPHIGIQKKWFYFCISIQLREAALAAARLQCALIKSRVHHA